MYWSNVLYNVLLCIGIMYFDEVFKECIEIMSWEKVLE